MRHPPDETWTNIGTASWAKTIIGPEVKLDAFPGRVVIAIGDVHGRSDLLRAVENAVVALGLPKLEPKPIVVLLGDLIDRGPDSIGVLQIAARPIAGLDTIALSGNHEQMLRSVLSAKNEEEADERMELWSRNGGDATLLSLGLDISEVLDDPERGVEKIERALGGSLRLIEQMPIHAIFGNVLLVHAGVHPAKPILEFINGPDIVPEWDTQSPLWIREPFLGWDESLADGFIVIHGHTVRPNPETAPHRIGIDTGAASSGNLTAAIISDGSVRFLMASDAGATTMNL